MITEDELIALSRRVRDLLDAEIAHLGIKDADIARQYVAYDIEDDMDGGLFERWSAPPMPPEGDPSYSPAIHGARSPEHLMELIEEGLNSGERRPYSRALMDEIIAEAQQGIGLDKDGITKRPASIDDLERLNQILEASMAMEDQALPITPQLWEDMKRRFFAERGLDIPTPTQEVTKK